MTHFRLFVCAILAITFSSSALRAQENAETTEIHVPDPLFKAESAALSELRRWSLDKWQMVRKTNHPLYHNALGVIRFRTYIQLCRRTDLKVDMATLDEMAAANLSEIVAAHYEEPEWAKFSGMPDDAIRTYLADVGQDIYAFEYAMALTEQRTAKDLSEQTTKAFCTGIAKENHDNYIALRATAKRQLGR